MESMEEALALALLGVSGIPLAGEGAAPDGDERPPAEPDEGGDDLDFEAAFASY